MKKLLLVFLVFPLLSGCASLLFAGGAETAVVVAQERSVGDAATDAAIFLKIKKAFATQKDNEDLIANVEVKVLEGRVLLTGNVDKADTQIDAVRLVWQVDGVKEVINEIQLSKNANVWNYARDVWISTQVRSRLLFASDIYSINYSIITVNQTVYIMGIARDSEELRKVTHIASTTNYVQKVVSYAKLKDDARRQ